MSIARMGIDCINNIYNTLKHIIPSGSHLDTTFYLNTELNFKNFFFSETETDIKLLPYTTVNLSSFNFL